MLRTEINGMNTPIGGMNFRKPLCPYAPPCGLMPMCPYAPPHPPHPRPLSRAPVGRGRGERAPREMNSYFSISASKPHLYAKYQISKDGLDTL
jgi:hypothetical protein